MMRSKEENAGWKVDSPDMNIRYRVHILLILLDQFDADPMTKDNIIIDREIFASDLHSVWNRLR